MKTFPVRCLKCKSVFTVPGDLVLNKSGVYDSCPKCKEQNSWEKISWDDEHKEE